MADFKTRCPDCNHTIWATTERRMEKAIARHRCKLSPEEAQTEQETTPPINLNERETNMPEAPTPPKPEPPEIPKGQTEEKPPEPNLSPIALMLRELANGQQVMAQALNGLAEAQKANTELQVKVAAGVQFLANAVSKEIEAQPSATNGQPVPSKPAGSKWEAILEAAAPAMVQRLLLGGAPTDGLGALAGLAKTLNDVKAIVQPFMDEYSRGARETAETIQRGYRVGADVDAMAESVKETHKAPAAPAKPAGS